MEKLYKQLTVLNLTVIVALNLIVMAVYSFMTKQFFASDSFTFLLSMIDSSYFVDFYTDRQYANYVTQFIPFLALKYFDISFTTLQKLWGANFIALPMLFLLLSLKNFSKSYKGFNLYLVCLSLFVIPMTTRWISEAVICIALTIYIFSFYYKNKPNLLENVLVFFSSFILVKSYSTTAFSNIFLIYLIYKNTSQHGFFRIITSICLIGGVLVGWKSIIYPFFPLTHEDVFREIGTLFFNRINEIHISILAYSIIVIGLGFKSKRLITCSFFIFAIQLFPFFWNDFLSLNGYRYLLSFPVLITLIILWSFRENYLNNKYLSVILLFGMLCTLPGALWRIDNWRISLERYKDFYSSKSGEVNIFNSVLRPSQKNSPFGWEALSYQLLFKKNHELKLFYKGPEHESWIQDDFNKREKKLKEKGWR